LYDGAQKDKRLQLVWNGIEVPESDGGVYIVTGVEGADFKVIFLVAWAFVELQGNNKSTPLYYRAHDAVSDNYAVSGTQSVYVYIQDTLIADPVIQHLDPDFDNLNCNSLRPGLDGKMAVVVFIPPDPEFKDKAVHVVYQAYSDPDGVVELQVRGSVDYTISEQESIDGCYIYFPYRVFDETGSGFGAIKYSVVLDGHLSTSERHFVRVLMREGDGSSCNFTPSP
jgi:hypothetical protein